MSTFFGLPVETKEIYELQRSRAEMLHIMKYHGNYSVSEFRNLPIGLRRWLFNMLVDTIRAENGDGK